MPISGLVLSLTPDMGLRKTTISILKSDPRVTVGAVIDEGAFQAIVTVTKTMTEHMKLWDELEALEGVLQTRLAFHDFSDVDEMTQEVRRTRLRRSWSRGG